MKKIKRFGKFDLLLDLKQQGVSDIKILNIIEDIDRSLFIDTNLKEKSNLNVALPIDCGQTISQPLVVAHMTQTLDISKKMRVLEIGTGSGYQSLVLSKLSRFVYTIERHNILLKKAKNLLQSLEINNVFFKHADGGLGWSDQAPFDRIIVTACAPDRYTRYADDVIVEDPEVISYLRLEAQKSLGSLIQECEEGVFDD